MPFASLRSLLVPTYLPYGLSVGSPSSRN